MTENGFSLRSTDNRRERGGVRMLHRGKRAKVFEQAPARLLTDARNIQQLRVAIAHLAALTVEGDGETVGFVADALDDVQDRRMALQHHRFIFLSEDVDNLFPFRNGGQWLAGDFERLQGFRCAMRSEEHT